MFILCVYYCVFLTELIFLAVDRQNMIQNFIFERFNSFIAVSSVWVVHGIVDTVRCLSIFLSDKAQKLSGMFEVVIQSTRTAGYIQPVPGRLPRVKSRQQRQQQAVYGSRSVYESPDREHVRCRVSFGWCEQVLPPQRGSNHVSYQLFPVPARTDRRSRDLFALLRNNAVTLTLCSLAVDDVSSIISRTCSILNKI